MPDFLRPVLARIAGALVGAVVTWLAAHFGIVVPEGAQVNLSESAVIIMMTLFSIVYALVHKAISAKTNPADAATPTLADKGKTDQRVLEH